MQAKRKRYSAKFKTTVALEALKEQKHFLDNVINTVADPVFVKVDRSAVVFIVIEGATCVAGGQLHPFAIRAF